jgi:hypothetical protein
VLAHLAGTTDIGIGHGGIIRSKYVNMSQGAAALSSLAWQILHTSRLPVATLFSNLNRTLIRRLHQPCERPQ